MLAAGSTGTPLIAQASDLADTSGLVGVGLTDHPVYVVSFTVPRTSRWYTETDSCMVLSRDTSSTSTGGGRPPHPYNVKLSLNSRLTQSRFVEPDQFRQLLDEDRMPCQLVFLLESALLDGTVTADPQRPGRPQVTLSGATVDPDLQAEMDAYAEAVCAAFDGQDVTTSYAPLGGVAHEAGSMRMTSSGPGPAGPGVVDEHLRMLGCDNVYVCDLSVFPSIPAANPTLTLAALALRLAAQLGS